MDEETALNKKKTKALRDGNAHVLADVEKKLGDLYFDKKQYEDALECYKGQLQACKRLHDQLNCAIAHRMIGEVNAYIGNFYDALEHQNLYLEIAKKLENLTEEQRAYATLGRTYFLVAESVVKDSSKNMAALKDAKKAFSKSIKLCDKLENKIDTTELMMMRARLLLNLGLVLEQQKETEQALTLIKQAAALCKKHQLHEDLHRTYIALAGLNERSGNFDQVFKNLDDAVKVDDVHLKNDARLMKAEFLLKLGEWSEAQKILHNLYKSKRLLEPTRLLVTKLLRIAVVLNRSEDKLLVENNVAVKEKLYETMGDAAVAAKSLDKAVDYYQKMLTCAEVTKSNQLGAALTSLAQTLKDAGKFKEAIPYARRELELCTEPKEELGSLLFLAGLMIDAGTPDKEIRSIFNRALATAKKTGDPGLERSAIKDFIEYLEKMDDLDLEQIESLKEMLESLPEFNSEDPECEEEPESQEIGTDICLDELSDVENEEPKEIKLKNIAKPMSRRSRYVIKKNEKGETQLHVACIKGNVSQVERLLDEKHPTLVRDHCGWTPLHEAANHGFVEIVRLLVAAGADVNDPGGAECDGVTPLHDAAANGHTAVVMLLLDSGANPNLLTKLGDSALDCLEQWKSRNDLSSADYVEYVRVKARLKQLITVRPKKKKQQEQTKISALVDDEDEDTDEARPKKLEERDKPERISAGEDYKRTIAAMQHPGRQLLGTRPKSPTRITAPLIDSEEMLVDDNWLEDDLALAARRKERGGYFDGVPPAATVTAKRKSKNDEVEREVEKSTKRQKIATPSPIRVDKVVEKETVNLLDENSCSSEPNEEIYAVFDHIERWPRKKKVKQTNLLKQGFTKNLLRSGSSSPTSSVSPEPTTVHQIEQERASWDSGFVSETLDLEISVDGEDFKLKLHFRDLRKTMSDIEELIRHKFEIKTGCKPRMTFKTADGVALAAEVTLNEIPQEKNKLRLFGEITQNELPPIVDRYKKVCEAFGVEPTDSMLRSLRSCDNTSTFRLSSSESCAEELEPLARCLRYQVNLRSLNLSSATLYDAGGLLAEMLERLTSLSELHLQCCDIDPDCLAQLQRLPPQIRVLDLSYNPLGAGSQRKLAELLEPLKHLQTLSLRSCELDDFRYTFTCTSLVNLDISWNPMGGEGAAKFLQRQLLNLNLSNTQNFACNRVNVIDKIFFKDPLGVSFATLESLELSSCEATDLDVDKILSQTPNLTRINLSNNINVTKTSVCALLRRKPTMSYIDVSGCRIIDSCPDAHLKLLTPGNCTLIVCMKHDVIDSWESLWQNKGYSKKLPHNLVLFKPT